MRTKKKRLCPMCNKDLGKARVDKITCNASCRKARSRYLKTMADYKVRFPD